MTVTETSAFGGELQKTGARYVSVSERRGEGPGRECGGSIVGFGGDRPEEREAREKVNKNFRTQPLALSNAAGRGQSRTLRGRR